MGRHRENERTVDGLLPVFINIPLNELIMCERFVVSNWIIVVAKCDNVSFVFAFFWILFVASLAASYFIVLFAMYTFTSCNVMPMLPMSTAKYLRNFSLYCFHPTHVSMIGISAELYWKRYDLCDSSSGINNQRRGWAAIFNEWKLHGGVSAHPLNESYKRCIYKLIAAFI